MAPRKRKEGREHWPKNLYPNGKSYRYKDPITGDFTSLTCSFEQACKEATIANLEAEKDLVGRRLEQAKNKKHIKTFRQVMEIHKAQRLAERPNLNTNKTLVVTYNKLARAPFVDRLMSGILVPDLDEWMRSHTQHQYRRLRTELVGIWELAVRRGWQHHRDGNIAKLTELLPAPKSERERLPVAHMYRIVPRASLHLRLAVYIILQTTCRPCDVVWMRRADFVGNTIRTKIHKSERNLDPETAKYREFILPDDIAAEIRRMSQDGVASPFIVHKRTGITKKLARGYEHWSQCTVDLLSREFSAIRDELGLYDHIENKRQRPCLYECRALAGHLMTKQGYSEKEIQERMAHSEAATTRIYTGRHEAFKPEYVPVQAGLNIHF